MKVGEARGIYSSVLKSYNQQKFKLSKQRNELKERMESTPGDKVHFRLLDLDQAKEIREAEEANLRHEHQEVVLPEQTRINAAKCFM